MEKRHRLDIRSQTAFEHHHEYDTKHDRQQDTAGPPSRRRVSLLLTVVHAPAVVGTYNGTLSVKAFNGLATKVTTALAASSK